MDLLNPFGHWVKEKNVFTLRVLFTDEMWYTQYTHCFRPDVKPQSQPRFTDLILGFMFVHLLLLGQISTQSVTK